MTKIYIHKNLEWYVLGSYNNRSDAFVHREDIQDKIRSGEINQNGIFEILPINKNGVTKYLLLGRPI